MNTEVPKKRMQADGMDTSHAAAPIRSILKKSSSDMHVTSSQVSLNCDGIHVISGRRNAMTNKVKKNSGKSISFSDNVTTYWTEATENGILPDPESGDGTELGNETDAEGLCWNEDDANGSLHTVSPSLEGDSSDDKEIHVETKNVSSGFKSAVKSKVSHLLKRPSRTQVQAMTQSFDDGAHNAGKKRHMESLTASCGVVDDIRHTAAKSNGAEASNASKLPRGASIDSSELFSSGNQNWASKLLRFGRKRWESFRSDDDDDGAPVLTKATSLGVCWVDIVSTCGNRCYLIHVGVVL